MNPHAARFLVTTLVLATTSIAFAERIEWKGPADGGAWEKRSNWDPERVPGPGDDVVIKAGAGLITINRKNDADPLELKSLTLLDSGGAKRTTLQPVVSGRHLNIVTKKDLVIGKNNFVRGRDGKAPNGEVTNNDLWLESKEGAVVVRGFVYAGNAAPGQGAEANGGDILIMAQGVFENKGLIQGGTAGKGLTANHGLSGDVLIVAERIINDKEINGGTGGLCTDVMAGNPKGGKITLRSKGVPAANDADGGLIRAGRCQGGGGALNFNGQQGPLGEVHIHAEGKGKISVTPGKQIFGGKVSLNSVGGVIDLVNCVPGDVKSKSSICLNAGVGGSVLFQGGQAFVVHAVDSVSILGIPDVAVAVAEGLCTPKPEWVAVACNACVGDVNGDGLVDGDDLGLVMAALWSECTDEPCAEDVNGDGMVDTADIAEIMGLWGSTCE